MTTDLSSGRPVKVKLTVATNGPGSTLRNKVQIVVSLLNLRDTTKKKAEARKALKGAANKADDDGDNDGDGDDEPDTKLPPLHFSHASSSIDTSLYDDQDIVPSDQPVVEFIFDLDTQASFDRISQLTSSMAPDLSDLDDTYDSESVEKLRLLWYFARYVVFMITVLGRAADEGFHPQLSD
ncbi:hypothetical protein N7509_005018 [Penicillium cosmopolitanum]|uniref:Uncharacterized protein n=1 Tax=Penicillium cosmopolitanum TaxID=1131564 RepID=A0A9W9W1E6_9EURO|nr:uncharacterized protein N7509_005018 [Penicillium cosmopolitanum]KAJ5396905.1 hypothetical protein N7509_005018 [Penicillium cosmopolitanum]